MAAVDYEYCLAADGQWMPDPLAKANVANPFAGRNLVVKVADSAEASHLADAENLPLKNAKNRRPIKSEQTFTS